jgi:Na+/melibiose symporter-like transporter
MASGKILNLISAFAVAKVGLLVFDEDDIHQFRIFLVILAGVVAVLFLVAQVMTHYHVVLRWKSFGIRFLDINKRSEHHSPQNAAKLQLKQIAKDFWCHKNFWAWIWMELLLESQNSFSNAFLKTFVDRLVHDEGVSRERCDWLLSTIRPLGLILGIFCYVPIRKIGYKNVYTLLFASNIVLSLSLWVAATHNSTTLIVAFLMIYPAITTAVASSGFHL